MKLRRAIPSARGLLLGCCIGLALMAARAVADPTGVSTVIVADKGVTLTIESEHGRILGLAEEGSAAALAVPPDAGENFRLFVPTAENSGNRILGKDQPLSRLQRAGDTLRLRWDGPLVDEAGTSHAIAVDMEIVLRQSGVSFTLRVENNSSSHIAEVWYPVLGDVLGLDGAEEASKVTMAPPPVDQKAFTLPFGERTASYPGLNMAFVDLAAHQRERGLYIGSHDMVARYKLFRFFEQEGRVYTALAHHPFIAPGESFQGGEVVFQFHDGDWVEAGKAIYRPWFIDTFGLKSPDEDWIRQQGVYQMIMILLPEGNVNYRFCEVPQLARDGLKHGVKALQLAGWQRGGHDNGYPYYEPDPRLGTWEELEEAIAECHRMGVKVYFFVNITVVNLDTEWYKAELKDCGWESARGADYWIAGWGMGTLGSRMAHTVPLMAFEDMSFPAMHDGHLKYFKKLAEIGADGLHIDKMFPGHMNFNPRTALSPGQAQWEGAIRLIKDIHDECRAIQPDFCISFETNWDRVLSYGVGTWWAGNMSRAREVFPELIETVGLYQPYDYIGVNDAVRRSLTIMASPHHFNRSMAYPSWKGLSEYIEAVTRWREEAAETVFYGEALPGAEGLQLGGDGMPPGVAVGSYRARVPEQRGAVVTNNGDQLVDVQLVGFGADEGTVVRITGPGRKPAILTLPASVEIAPEHLVFVVEQPAAVAGK